MIYVHYTRNGGTEGGLMRALRWPSAIAIALLAKAEGFDKVWFQESL